MKHPDKQSHKTARVASLLRPVADWLRDPSGNALIFSALALPVILGGAALALDVASWFTAKRQLQTVADSSAMAGMHVLASGGTSAEAETAIRAHAQGRLGFDIADPRRDLQFAYDDGSGTGVEAISVTVTEQRASMLSSVFMKDTQAVNANARAANLVLGESCVLSLEETAGPAIDIGGGAAVNASCGFASNSSAPNSINVQGASSLTADELLTYGEIEDSDEALINGGDRSKTQENFFRLDDPYADLVVPPFTNCDVDAKTIVNGSDNITISPDTYCKDISVLGGSLHLNPGVYVLHGANFKVTGGTVDMVGVGGVTIILTGNTPGSVGNVTLTGGTVTLTAPDANGQTDPDFPGEYAGVLFFMDPIADPGGTGAKFTGGVNMILDGAIYMPSRSVDFAGSSSAAPTGCLQIVAQQVNFTGTSDLDNTTAACEALGLVEIGERRVRLVL
jgi:hypothetical protein